MYNKRNGEREKERNDNLMNLLKTYKRTDIKSSEFNDILTARVNGYSLIKYMHPTKSFSRNSATYISTSKICACGKLP